MQTIKRIALNELYQLFYSPIAWALLIILTFQCGLTYHSMIENSVISQELGYTSEPLTISFIGGRFGVFNQIAQKLYLYIPLITMGLLSRETSSGTIKLLYSSPISIRSIVIGKFLAMATYNLILLTAISSLVLVALIHIQSVDIGILLASLLGLYLLLCVYSAIGLFLSSLTSYQVVAAIGTITVFAALSYVGGLWQDIDIVRDLSYFLSISGRVERLLDGLIRSNDIGYFVIITLLFLGLTALHLVSKRKSHSNWLKFRHQITLFAVTLALGFLISIPALILYYDVSATKTHTISDVTKDLLSQTDHQKLEVTSYVNLLDRGYWIAQPRQRHADFSRWEKYVRFKNNTKLNYVYYYDNTPDSNHDPKELHEAAKNTAKSFRIPLDRFKSPDEIRKTIDLRPEENRYVMQMKLGERHTFLRIFNDMQIFPSEREVAAAIKRLIQPAPTVAFLQGEYERNLSKIGDRDYKTFTRQLNFRNSLVNQGFDVITLDSDVTVPDTVSILCIADPRQPFSSGALANIQSYINRGGNLILAGEPDKREIINTLLQPLGISLDEGTLVQQHKDFAPTLVLAPVTDKAGAHNNHWKDMNLQQALISMPNATSVSFSEQRDYSITPLLQLDDSLSWQKKTPLTVDSLTVLFNAAQGDQSSPLAPALMATRTVADKEQRIIILGDADLFSNSELSRQNVQTANLSFILSIFQWLSNEQFPIDIPHTTPLDTRLNFTSEGKIRGLKIVQLGVLPGLLLIGGTILLIRRRRR